MELPFASAKPSPPRGSGSVSGGRPRRAGSRRRRRRRRRSPRRARVTPNWGTARGRGPTRGRRGGHRRGTGGPSGGARGARGGRGRRQRISSLSSSLDLLARRSPRLHPHPHRPEALRHSVRAPPRPWTRRAPDQAPRAPIRRAPLLLLDLAQARGELWTGRHELQSGEPYFCSSISLMDAASSVPGAASSSFRSSRFETRERPCCR